MAGSAELLERQTGIFDFDAAEAQFASERPPESEIYGRSLSALYRWGKFVVGKSQAEAIRSPEAAQAKEEFFTSVEEGFGTDKKLGSELAVRKFWRCPVIDGKIVAKDGIAISKKTEDGLKCAEETARTDSRFLSLLTRAGWDHGGALINDKMARGETDYNFRIVGSPCPIEAIAQIGPKYLQDKGFVPHLERGFIWIYYAGKDGVLGGSLSFDGTDIDRLREVFRRRGVDIPEGEITDNWPSYAVTGTLSEEEAVALALGMANEAGDPKYNKTTNTVEVTSEHHKLMDAVFNDSYIHACESLARGYQTPGAQKLILQLADKAGDFVNYADDLYRMRANKDQFTDRDMIVLHELLVYSTIEMMRALHLQATEPSAEVSTFYGFDQLDAAYLHSLNSESFQDALSSFGATGARNNHVYSACGLAIAPGETNNPEGGAQNPFGGITAELSGKKLMSCPFCKTKVFDDPCATILSCRDCRAKVVNGRVVDKGDGGSKVREKQAAEKQKQEAELAKQVDAVYKEKQLSAELLNKKLSQSTASASGV